MEKQELDALVKQVGALAAERIDALMTQQTKRVEELIETAKKQGGGLSDEQYRIAEKANQENMEAIKEIVKKQGVSLEELAHKMTESNKGTSKSIAETLYDNREEIDRVKNQGSGGVTFMVNQKADGQIVMNRFSDANKAAGPTGTVSGLGGVGGNVSSITQSIDSASLLRLGGMAMINGLYRNTQWLFDLVNVVQASFTENPLALWFEETAPQGSAAVVAEGAVKPLVQYAYTLKSATYKKVAQLVTMTEEFSLDFARLQSDIMGKGRTDVLNQINAALLVDLTAAATAYNTATQFKPGGTGVGAVTTPNDYDAIAAMAAQADNATYGANTNAAIMSTFKKYRMGITKSTQGEYLNRPDVLDNLAFVGNPSMGADAVIVGDLRQMTLILRGGFLVKVGYNADDFSRNQFSVVMEQYYYSYIPEVRKAAIVKGPNFADVKTVIGS